MVLSAWFPQLVGVPVVGPYIHDYSMLGCIEGALYVLKEPRPSLSESLVHHTWVIARPVYLAKPGLLSRNPSEITKAGCIKKPRGFLVMTAKLKFLQQPSTRI